MKKKRKRPLKVCLHVEKNGARLDANRLLERREPISRSAFGLTLLMREPSIISFASIDQEHSRVSKRSKILSSRIQQSTNFWLCSRESICKVGVYRRSIFKIRPNILIGLQKLRLRPKDRSRSRLFIYLIF